MHIKREDGLMIMTSGIVCTNYINMNHIDRGFEKINDYEYKCKACGIVTRITRTPIIILNDKGRLNVQVVAEPIISQSEK